MKSKGVSIIGCGYVGLCLGACLADNEKNKVEYNSTRSLFEEGFKDIYDKIYMVDINQKRIDDLNKGIMPFYEPGLEDLVKKNTDILSFTTDFEGSVLNSDIIFIAVGTPTDEKGNVDLSGVFNTVKDIGKIMKDYKLIVNKSTVPVGTADLVKKIIRENYSGEFDVVSNPEFLREGKAIHDTINPDRVVIGSENLRAEDKLKSLYAGFKINSFVCADIRSAELIKYASNAFLATKISFINEIARICEITGADVGQVALGMGLDKRIGHDFLQAGIGYGGSCLPKDNRSLIRTAGDGDYDFKILRAVEEVNKNQRELVIDKLEKNLGNLDGKVVGLLGLSFKPNTDDMRAAPSLDIIKYLKEKKAIVKAYDPMVKAVEGVDIVDDPYKAIEDADAVVLVTEWDEIRKLDFIKVKAWMKGNTFIDGRNCLSREYMLDNKFNYISIGR